MFHVETSQRKLPEAVLKLQPEHPEAWISMRMPLEWCKGLENRSKVHFFLQFLPKDHPKQLLAGNGQALAELNTVKRALNELHKKQKEAWGGARRLLP